MRAFALNSFQDRQTHSGTDGQTDGKIYDDQLKCRFSVYFYLFFFSQNARQLPHNLLDNGTARVFVVVVALSISYENDKMSTLLAVDVDAI